MISVFRLLKHSLLSNRLLKHSLLSNRRFQCPECLADNFFPQCKLLGLFQSRIPQRIGDGYCRNNPICPDRQRDRSNRTDMDNRKTCLFDFFYHRCTATRTGPSGRGQDDRIYPRIQKSPHDLLCVVSGRSHGCAVSDGGIEEVMQLADHTFFFQLTQHVDRKYTVRIFVRVDRIITAVGCFPCFRTQGIQSGNAVFTMLYSPNLEALEASM